jgi:putative FmdB family regulatory protein
MHPYTFFDMPTYEYACKACGHRIEVVQSMSEEPLKVCGVCGGELRKVFHPAGVLFKGSGFYSTDSRGSPKTASSDSGREGAKAGSDGAKEPSTAAPSKQGGRDGGRDGGGADAPKRTAGSGDASSERKPS